MSLSLEEQLLFNYLKIMSVTSYEEAENVYREILVSSGSRNNSQNYLDAVLSSINAVIKTFDLEIVGAVDEISSKKILCLISTNDNSVAQKACFYDKTTCELLSKIIQECIKSETGSVSQIFCLNVKTSSKANKSIIQCSLERLIKDKWLVSQGSKILLGMRCQLELELSIRKQYPDYVKYCALCKSFLMQGVTCSECESRTHYHCIQRYKEMNSCSASHNVCPVCKETVSDMMADDGNMASDEVAVLTDPPAKRMRTSCVM